MDILFPSFFDKPANIKFIEQEADENIELVLRRHGITNTTWITISLLLFISPFILLNIDQIFQLNILLAAPAKIIIGFFILWYMFVLAYILEQFLHWYFNVYIITNQHLVEVEFYSLLSRSITAAQYNDIQSVSARMSGIGSSVFNYGDVIIETASDKDNIAFTSIPKPDLVADRIEDLQRIQEGT